MTPSKPKRKTDCVIPFSKFDDPVFWKWLPSIPWGGKIESLAARHAQAMQLLIKNVYESTLTIINICFSDGFLEAAANRWPIFGDRMQKVELCKLQLDQLVTRTVRSPRSSPVLQGPGLEVKLQLESSWVNIKSFIDGECIKCSSIEIMKMSFHFIWLSSIENF